MKKNTDVRPPEVPELATRSCYRDVPTPLELLEFAKATGFRVESSQDADAPKFMYAALVLWRQWEQHIDDCTRIEVGGNEARQYITSLVSHQEVVSRLEVRSQRTLKSWFDFVTGQSWLLRNWQAAGYRVESFDYHVVHGFPEFLVNHLQHERDRRLQERAQAGGRMKAARASKKF